MVSLTKGLSDFGKFHGFIVLVMIGITGLIMSGTGFFDFMTPNVSQPVRGRVVEAVCQPQGMRRWRCFLDIEYKINGVSYTSKLETMKDRKYNKDDIIVVYYDLKDPTKLSTKGDLPDSMALAMFVCGILIVYIANKAWTVLKQESDFAAVYGGISAVNMVM